MLGDRDYRALWIVVALVLGTAAWARAEVSPGDVLLVYNRNVPASGDLARYYATKRGIPAGQMIGLDLPDRDEIPRDAYLQKIRQPLRGWLDMQGLTAKIKCIVTFYGVPLRVGKAGAQPSDGPLVQAVRQELEAAVRELGDVSADLLHLAGESPTSQPATRPAGKLDVPAALSGYGKARAKAVTRQREIRDAAEGRTSGRRLEELLSRGEGVVSLLVMAQATGPGGAEAIAQVKAQVQRDVEQARSLLQGCPRAADRQEGHLLLRRLYGLSGLIEHLQQDQAELAGDETQAALDSELSLLWWDDYPLYRWVLNPLCLYVRNDTEFQAMLRQRLVDQPVVMVSRLDGPKPEIVRRMIDDALATEQQGLSGTFYIDARGLKADSPGYGQYDDYLRDLAGTVRTKTSLSVVLDDKPEVFAAGACPEAALYCGWYSLGKYVDAFQWAKGSVAYHIASSEAVSLRKPQAQYWCKRMLEEGVCATLGPVAEPYLISFPPPQRFFGLLLTGRYTLVECYYLTNNFNSWMQTLLGDPLYNPYKGRAVLPAEEVVPQANVRSVTR